MYSDTRKIPYVNITIIALNVLYFLYLEIAGSSEDTGFMIAHGAMYAPLVLEEGQYYRLLTSVFMHFGISHIMNNMLVLFVLGDNLERALGRFKYLIFYLVCGVGANVVSLAVNLDSYVNRVSAGASGAIFGVVGGLLYAVLVNRGRLEDLTTRQLGVIVVLTIYHGMTSQGIDNAAHIGGLVIGVVLCAFLYRKPKRRAGDFYEFKTGDE